MDARKSMGVALLSYILTFFIVPGSDCCWNRLKGFTIHAEPNYVQIYVDSSPSYANLMYPINVSLPERYRNTMFSNITIAVPAHDGFSVLTLCEVEVNLGKWTTCRAKSTEDRHHIINGCKF